MNDPHYVTVEEASDKVCPTMNVIGCIGPKCMAWRWRMFDKTPEHTNGLLPPPKRVYEYSTTHGYCRMVKT